MRKISFGLIILLLILFICIGTVNAAEIISVEYKNEQIQIKGTGTGQIQIVLFNSKNTPMYMTTTNAQDGKFDITLPKIDNIVEGNYKIKVANYDGSNVDEKILKVTQEYNNPKTGDNIMFYIILLSVAVLGTIFTIVIKKRSSIKAKL